MANENERRRTPLISVHLLLGLRLHYAAIVGNVVCMRIVLMRSFSLLNGNYDLIEVSCR
jgi:hypothetical protein